MEEVLDDQQPEILGKLESYATSAQIAHELQEAAQTDVISSAANGNSVSTSPMLSSVSSSMSSSFTDGSTIFPNTSEPSSVPITPMNQANPMTILGTAQSITQYISDRPSDDSITSEPQSSTGQVETPVIPRTDNFAVSTPTSVEPTTSSLFGWFSSSSFVSKVVEKTKSSVEIMMSTLDPQMKEYIKSGGEIDIIVASAKEVKIGPVREAMQDAFGCATVTGRGSESNAATQPVGFSAALRSASERIARLRESEDISEKQTIAAIEGFIVELQPENWYEMSCLLLHDPVNQITVNTFSQPTPIPTAYVLTAQDRTPSDYPLRWSGLAVTIGQVVEEAQPHIGRANWHQALTGVSRRETLCMSAKMLAYLYKQQFPTSYIS
ncbi:Protein PRRC1-A,Protein PRRC1,Protein PRRC1-B [Acanthosepion pharaonis]|uniref:Protein PRRC1-A,Protein PRRC1,Protein PRRC1-B n=1 Tax=Acanthosepion pharaonis TaxID=158019 RepID=A0A812C0P2_ACAPH|nr:Protein PRRC1-A,Protein PRRC1,Protein PRRC1-B [Sepia pharaonis]